MIGATSSVALTRYRKRNGALSRIIIYRSDRVGSRLQTIFGEGSASAEVMLVGEQPEIRRTAKAILSWGFWKAAGQRLGRSGHRSEPRLYTNSVKHFKYVVIERGRSLHKKPNAGEIRACNPWLQEEIRLLKPRVIVTLGATAAQALLGKQFRVTQHRGKPVASELAEALIATVHPSAVLRARDPDREQARQEFFRDMQSVAAYLRSHKPKVAGSR